MKRILLFVLATAFSAAIFAQQSGPAISWTETEHNFGTFKEEVGLQTAKFEFANTGNEPLYVTNVRASCGCTATDYSKEPVQPGGKGFVSVSYNSTGRPGKFNKSVTVTTNEFQPTSVIRITGEVIPKPAADTGSK